jgi:hypothetical protein
MKEVAKPDIDAFLAQHPVSDIDGGETNDSNVKVEYGAAVFDLGTGAGSGEDGDTGGWAGLYYDGDEESGAILEMPREIPVSVMVGQGVMQPVEGLDIGHTG